MLVSVLEEITAKKPPLKELLKQIQKAYQSVNEVELEEQLSFVAAITQLPYIILFIQVTVVPH